MTPDPDQPAFEPSRGPETDIDRGPTLPVDRPAAAAPVSGDSGGSVEPEAGATHGRGLDFGPTLRGLQPESRVFSRFKLLRLLGRGGMGVVWLAQDERLQREVALKFLPEIVPGDPTGLEDLKRETRRCLDLTHPNIVRIYDLVEEGAMAAIAMEFIDGRTLAQLRLEKESRVFSAEELLPWVRQICEALQYAHEKRRVVHRDLKPSNLMLDAGGEVKVADFGIASSLSETVTRLSRGGPAAGPCGTLVYMSPQQLMGETPTAQDDVYAFGATLYELLTSKPPFFRGSVEKQIETVVPPSVAERRVELGITAESAMPARWEKVIASCLEKDRAKRPQSMAELLALLEGTGGVISRGGTKRQLPRGRQLAAVAAGVAMLGGGGLWWQHHQRSQNELRSLRERIETARRDGNALELRRAWEEMAARDGGNAEAAAEVQRLRAVRTSLEISSNPPGALAALKGQAGAAKTCPARFDGLELGAVEVELSLPGCEPKSLTAALTHETKNPVAATLDRSTGSLSVTTQPAGMPFQLALESSEVAGVPPAVSRQGTGPQVLELLPTGGYRLTATRPGWPEAVKTVTVKRNETTEASLIFEEGELEVTSDPAGLMATVTGPAGAVLKSGQTPLRLSAVPVGPGYRVQVQRTGWPDFTGTAEVKAGSVEKVFHAFTQEDLDALQAKQDAAELEKVVRDDPPLGLIAEVARNDKAPRNRLFAAQILNEKSMPAGKEALMALLKETDPDVATLAAKALWAFGQDKSGADLLFRDYEKRGAKGPVVNWGWWTYELIDMRHQEAIDTFIGTINRDWSANEGKGNVQFQMVIKMALPYAMLDAKNRAFLRKYAAKIGDLSSAPSVGKASLLEYLVYSGDKSAVAAVVSAYRKSPPDEGMMSTVQTYPLMHNASYDCQQAIQELIDKLAELVTGNQNPQFACARIRTLLNAYRGVNRPLYNDSILRTLNVAFPADLLSKEPEKKFISATPAPLSHLEGLAEEGNGSLLKLIIPWLNEGQPDTRRRAALQLIRHYFAQDRGKPDKYTPIPNEEAVRTAAVQAFDAFYPKAPFLAKFTAFDEQPGKMDLVNALSWIDKKRAAVELKKLLDAAADPAFKFDKQGEYEYFTGVDPTKFSRPGYWVWTTFVDDYVRVTGAKDRKFITQALDSETLRPMAKCFKDYNGTLQSFEKDKTQLDSIDALRLRFTRLFFESGAHFLYPKLLEYKSSPSDELRNDFIRAMLSASKEF